MTCAGKGKPDLSKAGGGFRSQSIFKCGVILQRCLSSCAADREKKTAVTLGLNYAMVDIEQADFAILEEL